MSLLMDLMHLIDVVNYLIQDKITTLSVWGWTKQLRYYLLDTRKCVARMVCGSLYEQSDLILLMLEIWI